MSTDKQDNDIVKSKPIDLEVSNSPNVDKLGKSICNWKKKNFSFKSLGQVWKKPDNC